MSLYLWTVVPLALLHLWWWRRRPDLLRFQLLFDLVLAAVMGPALIHNADLNPVRCLERNRPFAAWNFAPKTELQPVQSDLVLQFHPWWEASRRRLHAGRAPLIGAEIGAGLPLLANGQQGLWAPVMLPVWCLGAERGSTVMALWKLELAGLGTFLFLASAWRLRFEAAAGGALAYGGSCYLVAWLLVPLAWIAAALPWLWWGAFTVLRQRAGWRAAVLVGLAVGLLVGCGLHPETAVIGVGSMLLAGFIWHPRRWRRLLVVLAVAAPLAVLLSWPTLRYIAASARVHLSAAEQPNRAPLPLELRLTAARQLLLPAANGHPARADWSAPYPHAAGAAGIGGVGLALALVAGVRRRHRRLLWAAAAALAAAAVLAYRVPPLDWVLVRIPPLDHMTLVRFVVLVPWGLALAAASTLEAVARGLRRPWWWRAIPVVLLAGVALSAPWGALDGADRALVLLSVAGALTVALSAGRPRWLPLLLAVELALLALQVNPVAARRDRLPQLPIITELERRQEVLAGRVGGVGGFLPANLASRYGVPELRAYDPLRPWPFARLMALMGEPEPVLGGPLTRVPAGLAGAWSVRHLLTAPGVEAPGWEAVWEDGTGRIWQNPRWLPELRVVGDSRGLPEDGSWAVMVDEGVDWARTAFLPLGRPAAAARRTALAEIRVEETRATARVSCDGPCLVVWARAWAPGWRALVDGRRVPLERANMAALGVLTPPGEHRVELRYRPYF